MASGTQIDLAQHVDRLFAELVQNGERPLENVLAIYFAGLTTDEQRVRRIIAAMALQDAVGTALDRLTANGKEYTELPEVTKRVAWDLAIALARDPSITSTETELLERFERPAKTDDHGEVDD